MRMDFTVHGLLAPDNILHTLLRMDISLTAMEGVNDDLIGELFSDELDGHICVVALALGYPPQNEAYSI